MKVEFTVDEVWAMMDNIVEQLADLKLNKKDLAALRRWRSDEMSPGDPMMRLLSEKVNDELQRVAVRNEVSPIKKPDWAT
ncbi:MAG TPA: hypothetical protein QGI71_02480 [Dehalococcoidia bacterium]|jgi:hypothetical protein|nr:hypothetical protein [Dehalococcoidia bacterium]